MIEVKNLRKTYRKHGAEVGLLGADFTVPDGQIVGILGENGAGKTTLLRSMAGLLPAQGQALFDGKPAAVAEDRVEAVFFEQRRAEHVCRFLRLVGHEGELHARGFERRQAFPFLREGARALVFAPDVDGAIHLRVKIFRVPALFGRQGARCEHQPPVAHERARLRESDRGAPERCERRIHAVVQIGQRIEHGAV